jgi:hypothetical protein
MASFHTKKSQFGYISEGLEMENVGVVNGHWNIFTKIGIFYGRWYILWSNGTFFRVLVSLKKIWQPRAVTHTKSFYCTQGGMHILLQVYLCILQQRRLASV